MAHALFSILSHILKDQYYFKTALNDVQKFIALLAHKMDDPPSFKHYQPEADMIEPLLHFQKEMQAAIALLTKTDFYSAASFKEPFAHKADNEQQRNLQEKDPYLFHNRNNNDRSSLYHQTPLSPITSRDNPISGMMNHKASDQSSKESSKIFNDVAQLDTQLKGIALANKEEKEKNISYKGDADGASLREMLITHLLPILGSLKSLSLLRSFNMTPLSYKKHNLDPSSPFFKNLSSIIIEIMDKNKAYLSSISPISSMLGKKGMIKEENAIMIPTPSSDTLTEKREKDKFSALYEVFSFLDEIAKRLQQPMPGHLSEASSKTIPHLEILHPISSPPLSSEQSRTLITMMQQPLHHNHYEPTYHYHNTIHTTIHEAKDGRTVSQQMNNIIMRGMGGKFKRQDLMARNSARSQ